MSAKRKWIAGVILSGVLLFGVAIGSIATWILVTYAVPDHHQVAPAFGLREDPYIETVLGRLERELNLNPEQREAIRKEMQQMAAEFRSLHDQTGRDMKDIIEKGQEKIKSHLNPEQIHEYEEHIANLHFRMKHRRPDDRSPEDARRGRFRHDREDDDDGDFMLPPPPPPPPPPGE